MFNFLNQGDSKLGPTDRYDRPGFKKCVQAKLKSKDKR